MVQLGQRERTQRPAQQDGNLGGNHCRNDDHQQRQRGIAGIEVQQDGDAADDLHTAHQQSQRMSKRQADSLEAPRTQLFGAQKLKAAFYHKRQTHNHTDQDHGKCSAHRCLQSLVPPARPVPLDAQS